MDHATEAAKFIADSERVRWHDASVWRARSRRDLASHSLAEWEVLRELASRIKLHTMSRLDELLEEFDANATRIGAQVHWARDAAEHNAIVAGILQRHGAKQVVKSKSMLTEECGLNPHLESLGIEVTDTDLGEWIVQLRGEHPSHIVTPAIHVRKEEVGQLFHERIGTAAGATDPQYLAEAARQHLRQKFLGAQAGITGVNFAVAETGGFVVCTNEGNADIGASVPPLHIASIGIEKIIPRVEDLGVFLRLLARSGEGAPLTQYSSHFTGPRKGGELHIVLVDNGRSRRLGMADFWHSLKCIRCGACMDTCPVYRRGGGLAYGATYSGPIGVILDPTFDEHKYSELPFHSTLCGSCSAVCPVKIDISEQIFKWRRVMASKGYLPLAKRLSFAIAGHVFAHPGEYQALQKAAAPALNHAPHFLLYNQTLNPWGRERDIPQLAKQTFREWYLAHRRNNGHQHTES
jgi:L-lactate dehydrogenase complex protein LldF